MAENRKSNKEILKDLEQQENVKKGSTRASSPCAAVVRELYNDKRFDLIKVMTSQYGSDKFTKDQKINTVILHIEDVANKCGHPIASKDGVPFYYNGKCWERLTESQFCQFLAAASIACGIKDFEAFSANFNKNMNDSFMLRQPFTLPEIPEGVTLLNCDNCTLWITCRDGMVDVEPRDHQAADGLLYVLPYKYDSTATAPKFKKFLNRVVPDAADQANMQEFIGSLFAPRINLEKCLYLYGSTGRNGKTTFKDIVEDMLGKNNVSSVSLADLCANNTTGQVSRYTLYGKILNACGETDRKLEKSAMFKEIVSGSSLECRLPYAPEVKKISNYAKLMFCSNSLPVFLDGAGKAEAARFIFIGFDVEIPKAEIDTELRKKITKDELPGILNWSIEGLIRLISNDNHLTENKRCQKLVERFEDGNNSVAAYVHEFELEQYTKSRESCGKYRIKAGPAALYGSEDVKDPYLCIPTYRAWCKEEGRNAVQRKIFMERMAAHGMSQTASRVFDILAIRYDE